MTKQHRSNRYADPTLALVIQLLISASMYQDKLDKCLDSLSKEVFEEITDELRRLEKTGRIKLDEPINWHRFPQTYAYLKRIEREKLNRITDYSWVACQIIKDSMTETCVQTFQDTYNIFNYTKPIDTYYIQHIPDVPNFQDFIQVRDTYIYDHYVNVPWCQDGKTYSERLYGHVANFRKKLEFVLEEGITNGKGLEWMKESWRKLTGSTAYDTARLLKTETMAMWSRTTKDAYLEMGIEYVEIVGDAACGGICLDYMGQPIKLAEAELGDLLPPYHPNCACSYVAWEEAVPEELREEDEDDLDE